MVWLSGLLPYAQVEQVFERIGGRDLPAASIWRQAQRHGQRLHGYQQTQQARVGVERVILAPVAHDHDRPEGVSIDGGMVHIRAEGWKEFKVGAVYEVVQREGCDPVTDEPLDLPCAEHPRYTAVLGDVQQFAPAVAVGGCPGIRRRPASPPMAPIDGSVADYFRQRPSDGIMPLHLALAAHALYPNDPARAQGWREQMSQTLFVGQVWRIILALERGGLDDHARYFRQHHRRMRYQEFRENGYPIGSGTVESGIKQFKARLTGAGMRWSRPGAERMLVLRAAVLGGTFDQLWAVARTSPPI
jgi:hypothetical protein